MRVLKKSWLPAMGVIILSGSLVTEAAEDKGPEFYGMFYLSMDLQKTENTNEPLKSEPSHWAMNSRGSRLGVRQEIPLNPDLTAIYKAEFGLEVDDGDKGGEVVTQRDIYLGVKGAYGQVVAGRFDTPLSDTEGKIDPFNYLLGDIAAVLGGLARVNNIVRYSTPTLANTVINIAFVPGENKDLDNDGINDTRLANAYSASAVYSVGNLYAALGLDKNMEAKTTTEIIDRSDRVQLAAKYQLGSATFGTIIQHAKDTNNSQLKETAFIVNTTYRIDAYTLKAQIGRAHV